jgi:hypothetical protein
LPIFCEKIGVFLKNNVMINFLLKLAVVGAKKAIFGPNFLGQIFWAKFFGPNFLAKIYKKA